MRQFLIALQFLAIFPIKIRPQESISPKDFGKSLIWFPLVGAIIGIILAAVFNILFMFPNIVRISLVLIFSFIITGGIHLDGFADTCDGLYGFSKKEKALQIMRDSHIGAIGAISLILLILFKFSLLASFHQDILWAYLILMPTFGRFMQSLACISSKYAREEGKAKYFIEYAQIKEIVFGLIFTLVLFCLLLKINGLILFLISLALIYPVILYINKRIDGMTGDTIGAVSEVAEVVFLFVGLLVGYRIMG